ncbi:MAG: ISKra4 family transposase [Thermoplasmata archaeon]
MELALLQQLQEVPDGSDEKNRLQDLLALLSARKSSESSSPSFKDSAPRTTSPDTGPNLSFGSIIGEISETMLRSSKRLDFGAMERVVKDRMLEETARNIESRLNEEIELNPAPFLCPECGRALQNKGRKSKTFTTSFGRVELRRRYGFCRSCRKGLFPDDARLGLDGSGISPEVHYLTGLFGAETDFLRSSDLLFQAARIRIPEKQVERIAKSLGEQIVQDEREHVEPDHHRPPTKRTIYGGMDGTGVPIQSRETAGRKGKQEDGSSKTREAKMIDFWEANTTNEAGIPVRDPGSVSYSASIESAACGDIGTELSDFAKRVEREAKRRGVSQAARVVILGDGATWIWKTADWLFPGSIHIVDRFHAKQHLSDLSKALFGSTPKAEEWTRYRYEELDGGRMDDLIKEIGLYSSRFPEAQQCRTYFQNNRERMRYPEFRSMGLCTSSGVVEAGCKSVVGGRLKKSGMHWSVAGANAILALRCSIKSGRYESFWERKASKLAA